MRDLFLQVFELQHEWTSANSPPMQERGVIIRDNIPASMSRFLSTLSDAVGDHIDDLDIEGSDGTGRKTPIPWVRFYSNSHSPSPQNGWYCVYLFHPDGSGVYLALAHGSTSFVNGSFLRRDPKQIAALMRWARSIVDPSDYEVEGVHRDIDLGNSSTKLDRAYEASTAFAKWYPAASLPSEDQLIADASEFSAMLGKIYSEEDKGRTPGQDTPELVELENEITEAAQPLKPSKGQGRGLTGPERKAVELRAMEEVKHVLQGEGYAVTDVSQSASYDFLASRGGDELYVEVKGSTGGLGSIILTANEVVLHQNEHPANALFVIHSIDLDKSKVPPIATGGTLHRIQPWQIADDDLEVLAFKYNVPLK